MPFILTFLIFSRISETSWSGKLEVAKYLVATANANFHDVDKQGRTPLHQAAMNGKLEIVKYLVETAGADIYAAAAMGDTPLDLAKKWSRTRVVKYLESRLTSKSHNGVATPSIDMSIPATDEPKHHAVLNAVRAGNLDRVRRLVPPSRTTQWRKCLKHDVKTKDADGQKDKDGTTPLDRAKQNGKKHVVEYLESRMEMESSDPSEQPETMAGNESTLPNNTALNKASLTDNVSPSIVTETPTSNVPASVTTMHTETGLGSSGTIATAIPPADAPYHTESSLAQLEETLRVQNLRLDEILSQKNDRNGATFTESERGILVQVIGAMCETHVEEEEKQAILASPHAAFYIVLCRKLYCMISAFEVLSSGHVDHGSGETMRALTARLLHEKSVDVLKGTKIGVFLADLVGHVKKNLAAVPFLETVGSICQLVLTLKDERDRYMSVARVADFATMVAITSRGDGLRCTVERFARVMVRARCAMPTKPFVETRHEFGRVKQLVVQMLGDSGNTPAKEQACKAADCCFAHIMKPTEGSDLHNVLHDPRLLNDPVAFHKVLVAATLDTSVEEISKLDKFTRNAPLATTAHANIAVTTFTVRSTTVSPMVEEHLTADEADESPAITNTVDYEAELAQLRRELSMVKRRLPAAQPNHSRDAGGGLMYADHREQYKDDLTAVIHQGKEHHEQIARLTTENAVLRERLEQLEDIALSTSQATPPPHPTRRRRGGKPVDP
jgi:Ankyrin repeats (3 copies)